MLPKSPRLRLTTMSAESPIYISSTESSPSSTPAMSWESSPSVNLWPQEFVGWPDPSALPFQEKLDLWAAFDNPRPTSEEVRELIRDTGNVFEHVLRGERDLHEKCNDVSRPYVLSFLSHR